MPETNTHASLAKAIEVCCLALRLNTLANDADVQAWPECPYAVMERVRCALNSMGVDAPEALSLRSTDPVHYDQELLLERMSAIACRE